MAKYETQYIRDEREVPPGYVALVEFDSQSLDHKRLSGAHARGLIRAVKMMRSPRDHRSGKVWVHHGDAKSLLATYDTPRSEPKPEPAHERTIGDLAAWDAAAANGLSQLMEMRLTLGRLESIVERLATAVENIATQPPGEGGDGESV